jgi:mannose-6-phosphate isomerase-like protein (cupin superfamily)
MPSVIPAGGGEVIGDAPDRRVEILSDHDSLHATWSRFGPGRDGADLHLHREHTDLFYVLEGEFTLRLGPQGEPRPLTVGTLAWLPPGVVHGFRNASDAELRFLNFHAPGAGFADYMRDLRDGRQAAYDQWDPPLGSKLPGLAPSPPEDGGRPISEAGFGDRVDLPAIKVFPAGIEPGAPESHEDARHTDIYVLEGDLYVNEARAKTGAWAHVAPGVPHTLEGYARFLVIHTPA